MACQPHSYGTSPGDRRRGKAVAETALSILPVKARRGRDGGPGGKGDPAPPAAGSPFPPE